MANFKIARLESDIIRELNDILRSVKDPRVDSLLTIVRVELSGDQSYCKVFVSSMKGMEVAKESVEGLKSAHGFIRRELAQRVKMRKSPELRFIPDDSIEHSAEISKKLSEIL